MSKTAKVKSIVVGANGQDSSYLIELLLNKGHMVYGVHRRSASPNLDRLKNVLDNPNFELVCSDITDYSSIQGVIERVRPDYIYNLAAMSHVGISFNQPLHSVDVTYSGVVNILESVRHLSMVDSSFTPKIYQASSSEMFGDGVSVDTVGGRVNSYYDILKKKYNNEYMFQDEQTLMRPQSPYAIAKMAAHHMCRLYRESYNMDISCGILFNHSGPRRGENFVEKKICNWVVSFIETVKNYKYGYELIYADGNTLTLRCPFSDEEFEYPMLRLGNLDANRDIGHAKDYVKAMVMMTEKGNSEYVVCTGETHSIRDILKEAFKYITLKWEECVVQDERFMRPAEVPHLKGNNKRITEELGWSPSIEFKEMIKEMINGEKPESSVLHT